MAEKKNSSSMFLYTALIFLVALIMIVLSFFGQSHLESTEETKQQAKTITEKASLLSEENLLLTEQVSSMQEQLEQKETDILAKQQSIDGLQKELEACKAVISAYERCVEGNTEAGAAAIAAVDPAMLTGDIKILYDQTMQMITQ